MKSKISVFLIVGFVVILCALTTLAQTEEQKAQLWFGREFVVKPPMAGQYEEAMKEIVARCAEHNYPYTWYAWENGDFHYFYFYPVKNYADIENIFKAWGKVKEKWRIEQYQTFRKRAIDAIEYDKKFVIRSIPGLSYVPENPRLKEEEQNYAIWDISYVRFGKEKEIEEVGKKMCALLKSKNYNDELRIIAGDMGIDMPVYIGVLYGKDVADFWTQNQKMWELLGEEGGVLYQKWMSLIRKRDFKQFWYSPDLSYIPKEK